MSIKEKLDIREAATRNEGRGKGGKSLATKKKELFLNTKKLFPIKMWPLSSRVRPQKRPFLRLPLPEANIYGHKKFAGIF